MVLIGYERGGGKLLSSFISLLREENINSVFREEGDGIFYLYVEEENAEYTSKKLNHFLAQKIEEPEEIEDRLKTHENREEDGLDVSCYKLPMLMSVAVICFVVFILEIVLGDKFVSKMLYHDSFYSMMSYELWRFITPSLMHASLLHLFMNMLCWFQIAKPIENKLSGLFLIGLTVSLGLVSNFFQFLFSGNNFLGLSGAIFGLYSFVWVVGYKNENSPFAIENSAIIFIAITILVGYLNVFPIAFANEAHLSGFVSGILIGYFFKKHFL